MSLWFITRGAGLSALILLTLATCLGALISRQRGIFAPSHGSTSNCTATNGTASNATPLPGVATRTATTAPPNVIGRTAERRYIAQYVHRALAGLGVLVLLLHITTVIADAYAHVGLTGALIPFTSGYRPTWVGLGSLAAYTMLAVAVLGLARGRMAATRRGARVWRGMHGLAYAGWATAMLHGFTSGTDSSILWVRVVYLLCLMAVTGCVWVRLVDRPGPQAATVPTPTIAAEASR